MKNYFSKPLTVVLAAALLLPATLLAQNNEKDKEKEKDKHKHENQQIIISRNSDKKEKIVVEVDGDKVTVNGKPIEEYKGDNVRIHKGSSNTWSFADGQNSWGFNGNLFNDNYNFFNVDSNRAMLGVTTEKSDKGVEIQEITSKESAAAKAGLKAGDVIIKVDGKQIDNPDKLTEVIRSHKPGDKVSVTYLRNDKEQQTTAELGKWKGVNVFARTPKMDFPDMNFDYNPKIAIPRAGRPYTYNYSGGSPKLGLSVQDTDDGKGVKVIEVDDESNAKKAGIKEDDIITEVEGKTVNSADEVAKIIKESKDKNSVMIKLTRNGKTQNIEVKIPRKLKTADL